MIATLEARQDLQSSSSGTVVASLENVSKNYEDVRALRNVDFTVRAGRHAASGARAGDAARARTH
jgi:hypothetical protein